MRQLTALTFIGALALASHTAAAATTYVGTWNNLTFGSSGGVTILLDLAGDDWSASIDLDGFVFGGPDPGPILLSGTFGGFGSSAFNVEDHPQYGDVSGSISGGVLVSALFTNLPDPRITEVNVSGCIGPTGTACLGGDIELTYEVLFADLPGLPDFAEGTLVASPVVVPLPATALLLTAPLLVLRRFGKFGDRPRFQRAR
ncbi:MAG: hypothetical protein AB7V59_19860 [Gammaproteobacteria bacterium]